MPKHKVDSPKESSENTEQQKPRSENRMPRPPMQTLIFWLIVLFGLPLTLLLLHDRTEGEIDELNATQFERYLREGLIDEAIIVRDPSLGIVTIKGAYTPVKTGMEEGAATAELRRYKVNVVYSDELDRMLREQEIQREVEINSNVFSNILISLLPILILVGLIYFLFSRQLRAAGKGALQFGKSRARMMSPTQERITFADVAGIDEGKEEVQEIVDYLRSTEKFQKLGGRIPKGVLMVGAPGTGKTLLARAIAGEADVPFFSISGSDFVEMFVGVGASRVRDMFEEGKRHAPCIIFIDEIDAVGRSRFTGIGGGHDEREQTLNALLVEMDGFEANTGVIVISATNRPDVLDPALLRPGRFDRRITIDLPDLKGRLGILKLHGKKVKLAENVDLSILARGTPGFSGADLANLINEAALLAARENKDAVEMPELEEARDKVRWGKERRSRKIDEKDRRVTAFHEAGHALVGMMCEETLPLHKITIVPRGVAYLGATMHLPEEDRYTKSRSEFLDELTVLMGGRVAEKLIFGDITSGAAMDIQQATQTVRKMVCQWGMSDKIGPLNYGGREEHIFLGRDITKSDDYSEATAREIDTEVKSLVIEVEDRARKILEANRDKLQLLGDTLLEKETMSAEEVYKILGMEDEFRKIEKQLKKVEKEVSDSINETAAETDDNEISQDQTGPEDDSDGKEV